MNVGSKLFFLIFLFSVNTTATCPDTASLLQRGHALKSQNQYLLSAQQYSLVSALSCNSDEKAWATYYYATSLYHLDESEAAESSLEDIKKSSAPELLKRKVQLLKAWYRPSLQEHLTGAEAQSFADFAIAKKDIEENQRLKTPWVAGTLSAFIPGMGQVYNQNYSSAAISFILNSLFLATALELQDHGLHAPALAAGVVFSITYTGNILSSVESSRQINRAYQAPLIDEARKKNLPDLEL